MLALTHHNAMLLLLLHPMFLLLLCRDEYLATGMLHMTNAVSFINNSCNMVRRSSSSSSSSVSGADPAVAACKLLKQQQ
jgi:hypothetical protein